MNTRLIYDLEKDKYFIQTDDGTTIISLMEISREEYESILSKRKSS